LSLFDLYHQRLDAELVVLSGCGTGLAAVRGADELVGLARGLLFAGARSTLVTLWDVHDRSTAGFMRAFYRHLAAGEAKADALRRAMLDHRSEHPQPYYWAPFVLVG
ncbi:MAG: CHAT domain-containing protein, partial [Holophagales bacterium]|nr:CHAT domain-containing protein [Holophagales bacterium]